MKKQISYEVSSQEDGAELSRVLRRSMGLSPREIRRAKFRPGGICVDGLQRRVTERVRQGERVSICLEEEETGSHQLLALPGRLQILYEDEDVLAVCKREGQVCHPCGGHYGDTLANVMQYYFRQKGENAVIRLIGRLDQETSGVVLAAKSQAAASRLSRQRELGILKKEYLALTAGRPVPDRGWVEEPIGPGEDRAAGTREEIRMQVRPDGKPARTFYETLATREGVSLLRLWLDTGRTHQIRVHMAWLGCPLLGDTLYAVGREKISSCAGENGRESLNPLYTNGTGGFTRAALHAWRLEFHQPFTGEPLFLEAPFPEDFAGYLVHFPEIIYNRKDMGKL